jgi:hypothetical protein
MKSKKRAPWPAFISRYSLKRGCPIHLVVESYLFISGPKPRAVFWVFLRTHKGWRWTLFGRNAKVIGAATEEFSSKYKAVRNAAFHGCPLWCMRRPWPNGMYVDVVTPSWDWRDTVRAVVPDFGIQYVA